MLKSKNVKDEDSEYFKGNQQSDKYEFDENPDNEDETMSDGESVSLNNLHSTPLMKKTIKLQILPVNLCPRFPVFFRLFSSFYL